MKGTLKRTTAAILAALLLATAGTATVTMISGQTSIVEAAQVVSTKTTATISTAEEFITFAQNASDYDNVTLTADIDFTGVTNFTPAGTENDPFTGTFDGGGHTIKNLTYSTSDVRAGIFGYVTGTVQNLEVDNVHITNTRSDSEDISAGVVIATLQKGTASGLIVNDTCTVSCSLRAGGIVGDARGKGAKIENCKNYATVTGTKYTGGIVGATHELNFSTSGAKITDCDNYGAINGTNEVGGIVGYTDRATLTNCDNYGTVSGAGDYGIGGIVGFDVYNYFKKLFLKNIPENGSTIEVCNNYGKVTATSTNAHVGGILGTYASAPTDPQPESAIYSYITDCENAGAIVSASTKVGAIFGYQHNYASGDGDDNISNLRVKITECTNTGTITVGDTTVEGASAALSGNTKYVEIIYKN